MRNGRYKCMETRYDEEKEERRYKIETFILDFLALHNIS